MHKLLYNNGKASSMPAGILWGGIVSLLTTVLLSALLAWLIVTEKMDQQQMGYGIMVILSLASFLGAKAAFSKIQRRQLLVCSVTGAAYFVTLLCIAALFFGGQYSGVGETGLMIFTGCMLAFLLKKPAGYTQKHRKVKTRYC